MADDLPGVTPKPQELLELEAQLTYSGSWAPLYVEPIIGSGERFTFAVAILPAAGPMQVHRLIRTDVLRLLYRGKAKYFGEMLDAVEKCLIEDAGKGAIAFPIDGFSMGEFRFARGRSEQDLVEQARMMCASLAGISTDEQRAVDAEEDERETHRWAQRVQEVVVGTAQDLGEYFSREWRPAGSSFSSKIGFFNGRYAAHFGVVRRGNPGSCLYHLNARLWTLASMEADMFTTLRQRDLILARPKLTSATMGLAERDKVRDVLDRVTAEADRRQIFVMHTDRVEEASRRVFENARAA